MLFALTLVAALGCALVAGVFFAFSAVVMKAVARLPAGEGIAAMQSIHVVVLNPWFMTPFLGTPPPRVLPLIYSLLQRHEPRAAYLLGGGVLYLIGTLLVTIVFNVPRNETLAAVTPASTDAARLWAGYVASWTAWNHVRTAAALAAAASFSIALGY